ncbi:MAG: PQQ-binding-like beta-propeller repeat protein [Planctomycetota bacterium]
MTVRLPPWLVCFVAGLFLSLATAGSLNAADDAADRPFTLVVMDPLSKPLSCDCVKGYAQRDYAVLGKKLEAIVGKPVKVVWHQSLAEALKETDGAADLVVGKHSVVVSDGKSTGLGLQPVTQLTGKDGGTTQHGLIVVRSADPAQDVPSLAGYDFLFGPDEAEEKSGAAMKLLEKSNITFNPEAKRFGACSEAATAMLEMPKDKKVAAVISSYAEPLLKGCGSIREGELRVVGMTEKIPFVTAFLNKKLPAKLMEEIQIGLLTFGAEPSFRDSLETLLGFVPWVEKQASMPSRKVSRADVDAPAVVGAWPQFRGPSRDGLVDWLPDQLPDPSQRVWSQSLPSGGVGGIAVDQGIVIVSGRDAVDQSDMFIALSLESGKPLWQQSYPAPAALDYGNSPRATPLIDGDVVYMFGATGVLTAVGLMDGEVRWQADLAERFSEEVPTWGFCSSPLVIEDTLYVQLGKRTPLVAIKTDTGETRWSGPGRPAGYSSLMSTQVQGRSVLIGTDQVGYFLRSADNGRYLWLGKRAIPGDFVVPAPIVSERQLFFTGENNGIECFSWSDQGQPPGKSAAATNDSLIPDSHTPVLVGDQLLVAYEGLWSLSSADGLKSNWSVAGGSISAYASIIASSSRALVTTEQGEVLLFDVATGKQLDSLVLDEDAPQILSHPAVAGNQLIVRIGDRVDCYGL